MEYLAGNLPIIVSAPHGGLLSPTSIPDRDCAGCTTVNDFNTQELARAFAEAVHERTGCWPHLIFNKLHRRKLDANRDIAEAADGNPDAELPLFQWGIQHRPPQFVAEWQNTWGANRVQPARSGRFHAQRASFC